MPAQVALRTLPRSWRAAALVVAALLIPAPSAPAKPATGSSCAHPWSKSYRAIEPGVNRWRVRGSHASLYAKPAGNDRIGGAFRLTWRPARGAVVCKVAYRSPLENWTLPEGDKPFKPEGDSRRVPADLDLRADGVGTFTIQTRRKLSGKTGDSCDTPFRTYVRTDNPYLNAWNVSGDEGHLLLRTARSSLGLSKAGQPVTVEWFPYRVKLCKVTYSGRLESFESHVQRGRRTLKVDPDAPNRYGIGRFIIETRRT